MNWIKNNYQRLLKLTSRKKSWQMLSTSIWQIDAETIQKQIANGSRVESKRPYISSALIHLQNANQSLVSTLHKNINIYPSLLSKFENKFQPNRINSKKISK